MTTAARTSSAAGLALDPVALEEFLEQRWDQRPLLVLRDQPGRFDAILSPGDAERMALGSGVRVPAFRLVRDGAQLPPAGYTKDVPWRPGSFSGMADASRVAEEFAAGATVVLQGLHLHWHPAALFCRGLEAALGCPVQANAYWTPSAAQGFAVHHDTHDVFVLQVTGRKRWRVYEPLVELPLATQRWSGGDPGDPVIDVELTPGSSLYLPRGWPHEAFTSDGDSLHLTVGAHPYTRLDVLRAELEARALEDVALRRAAEPAAMRRRFVMSRRPIVADLISQQTAPIDRVRRRETVIADLEDGTLHFEGRTVAFPPAAREALAWIHAADGWFGPGDLPGSLDAAGREVLLRRLVREGYLRAASSPRPPA